MKIYVIRHGITELNKKKIVNGQIDEPLAPEGIEQAKTALNLIPDSIKCIYVSPLQRASQTAEIINSRLKCPLIYCPEVSEINMGSLAGKSWDKMPSGQELKKKHRSVKFNYIPYGGESAAQVKKRLLTFLRQINNQYNNNQILIVTHGGIIRVLHLLESNNPLLDEIEHISLQVFDLSKIIRH